MNVVVYSKYLTAEGRVMQHNLLIKYRLIFGVTLRTWETKPVKI